MATRKAVQKTEELKARIYRLSNGRRPLSTIIQNTDKQSRRLLEKGTQRSLRYARNYPTPYMDEQDDSKVILEPIIFTDGMLQVGPDNIALQKFLHVHPDNGVKYEEIDKDRDAQVELDAILRKSGALETAKAMDISQLEEVASIIFRGSTKTMTTAELKRDVYLYAENNPTDFLGILDDPHLKLRSTVSKLFDNRILTKENKGRDVVAEMADGKQKVLTVPFAMQAKDVMTDYFLTDEGVILLKKLEKLL